MVTHRRSVKARPQPIFPHQIFFRQGWFTPLENTQPAEITPGKFLFPLYLHHAAPYPLLAPSPPNFQYRWRTSTKKCWPVDINDSEFMVMVTVRLDYGEHSRWCISGDDLVTLISCSAWRREAVQAEGWVPNAWQSWGCSVCFARKVKLPNRKWKV